MTTLGWAVVIWCAINAVTYVALIGKRREPMTAGGAAISVTIYLVIIVAVLSGWLS